MVKILFLDEAECLILGIGEDIQKLHTKFWESDVVADEDKMPPVVYKLRPRGLYGLHIGVMQEEEADEPRICMELCTEHSQLLWNLYKAIDGVIKVISAKPEDILEGKIDELMSSIWFPMHSSTLC